MTQRAAVVIDEGQVLGEVIVGLDHASAGRLAAVWQNPGHGALVPPLDLQAEDPPGPSPMTSRAVIPATRHHTTLRTTAGNNASS